MDSYADVFEFASHTFNLHQQNNGAPIIHHESRSAIREDFKKMGQVMNTEYIAYPFGAYNDAHLNIMKEFKYKIGFTTNAGYVSPKTESYKIPRFGIRQSTTLEDFSEIFFTIH